MASDVIKQCQIYCDRSVLSGLHRSSDKGEFLAAAGRAAIALFVEGYKLVDPPEHVDARKKQSKTEIFVKINKIRTSNHGSETARFLQQCDGLVGNKLAKGTRQLDKLLKYIKEYSPFDSGKIKPQRILLVLTSIGHGVTFYLPEEEHDWTTEAALSTLVGQDPAAIIEKGAASFCAHIKSHLNEINTKLVLLDFSSVVDTHAIDPHSDLCEPKEVLQMARSALQQHLHDDLNGSLLLDAQEVLGTSDHQALKQKIAALYQPRPVLGELQDVGNKQQQVEQAEAKPEAQAAEQGGPLQQAAAGAAADPDAADLPAAAAAEARAEADDAAGPSATGDAQAAQEQAAAVEASPPAKEPSAAAPAGEQQLEGSLPPMIASQAASNGAEKPPQVLWPAAGWNLQKLISAVDDAVPGEASSADVQLCLMMCLVIAASWMLWRHSLMYITQYHSFDQAPASILQSRMMIIIRCDADVIIFCEATYILPGS
jgi:hypothetical protein